MPDPGCCCLQSEWARLSRRSRKICSAHTALRSRTAAEQLSNTLRPFATRVLSQERGHAHGFGQQLRRRCAAIETLASEAQTAVGLFLLHASRRWPNLEGTREDREEVRLGLGRCRNRRRAPGCGMYGGDLMGADGPVMPLEEYVGSDRRR